MKKFIYLCGMMLLSINIMAQIDLSQGWSLVLDEQFSGTGRSWDSTYLEKRPSNISDDSHWKCLWRVNLPEVADGVTKKPYYHAYQRSNTLFNNGTLNDNKMRLVAQHISYDTLECDGSFPTGYEIPKGTWHHCDTVKKDIHYYSGNIQSMDKSYEFGYYEIECALPIHKGIHTSFWLYGEYDDVAEGIHYYEEIDIMEYSKGDWDDDEHRGYSSGIWYKKLLISDSLSLNQNNHYGYKQFHMAPSEPDISQMHIYGCEWMPDYVIYYRDGKVTHEFRDVNHIPQHPKYIKTGYAIDKRALESNWLGPDTLSINYIKAYKLNTDCGTDMYVQTAQQLNQIDSMKGSITISNPSGIALPSTTDKILRASDYFIINGPFEIATGAQLTLMVHECPNYTSNYTEMSNP